jgi:hypothetical protein
MKEYGSSKNWELLFEEADGSSSSNTSFCTVD